MYMYDPNNTNRQQPLQLFLNFTRLWSITDATTRSLPGGEFAVLGGDGFCHCEKEFHMNVCLILNGYRGSAV